MEVTAGKHWFNIQSIDRLLVAHHHLQANLVLLVFLVLLVVPVLLVHPVV
jgi:hypothetical protein